jgi:hypothetical protein
LTRLTNAFSQKIENYIAAVALGYFVYNFVKIHRTLRGTPAMAAGVTDRSWDVEDLVAAWEASERGGKTIVAASVNTIIASAEFPYEGIDLWCTTFQFFRALPR